MSWNWKIFLAIGIVVVLAAVGLFSQFKTKVPQITKEQTSSPAAEQQAPASAVEKPISLPPATGNVDDAVKAVLTATDNELSVLNEYETDVSLVTADSQAISDFGQAYDENTF